MEFFTKTSTVLLRSHHENHLTASPDHLSIHQTRRPSRLALWRVESVPNHPTLIRFKNLQTLKYITASTSNQVTQSFPPSNSSDWKPLRDGFQVKLRSAQGTFLRAAPWRRKSVTHDFGSIMVLWDVVSVEAGEEDEVKEYLASVSTFGSSAILDDDDDDHRYEPSSPMFVIPYESPNFSFRRSAMDLFHNAAAVRLCSHHDKYLIADEGEETVTQDHSGSSRDTHWVVEFVPTVKNIIRLKSRYNKYL